MAAQASPLKRKRSLPPSPPLEKRIRSDRDNPRNIQLTPAIWQHIFQYLHPGDLGRLLSTCKLFKTCLTGSSTPSDDREETVLEPGTVKTCDPQLIWAVSRQLHYPSIPEPLMRCSELDMWRLLKGKRCQVCHQYRPRPRGSTAVWERGPGESGLRAIWPFAVLICGTCLAQNMRTHSSLLLSEDAWLVDTFPYIYSSEQLHVIAASILESVPAIPPGLRITRVFYTPHITESMQGIQDAKADGSAAAEERFKAFQSQARSNMKDAVRWERWEADGGFDSLDMHPNSLRRGPLDYQHHTRTINTPTQGFIGSSAGHSRPPSRIPQDVNNIRTARQAEIVKRCQELDPPIPSNLLQHMDSFKAAVQISTPFNDTAWELLKPRILHQRAEAEKEEGARAALPAAQQMVMDARRMQDAHTRASKEEEDRRWQDLQAPLRAKLDDYATEVIRNTWADGAHINSETCRQFAAELLLYVRKRFYSDLAKDDAALLAEGRAIPIDPEAGPFNRKLTLENMKWIHDTRIKPLTENYSKELFFCNGCDASLKPFAFDGVIQHYAMKHTNGFSLGQSSVHWQTAEWPEDPPFAPDPSTKEHKENSSFSAAIQHPVPQHGQVYNPMQPPHSGSRPQVMQKIVMSPPPYGGFSYQMTPGIPPQGPYPPPRTMYSQSSPAFGQSTVHNPYGPQYQDPVMYPGYGQMPYYPGHSYFPSAASLTPVQMQGSWQVPETGHAHVGHPSGSNDLAKEDFTVPILIGPAPPPGTLNLYESQKEMVANVAHDVWLATSGIKGLAPSIRVYVIIHQVVSQFKVRFSNEPNLDLFSDALLNHKLMSKIKLENALSCKTCVVTNMDHELSRVRAFRMGERKLHPFHSLILHFKQYHVEQFSPNQGPESPRLDWKEDMIELPEDAYIQNLSTAPGMDDTKLQLIAEVFPSLFPRVIHSNNYQTPSSTPGLHEGHRADNVSTTKTSSRASQRSLNQVPDRAMAGIQLHTPTKPLSSSKQAASSAYAPPSRESNASSALSTRAEEVQKSAHGPKTSMESLDYTGPSPLQRSIKGPPRQDSRTSQKSQVNTLSGDSSAAQSPIHSQGQVAPVSALHRSARNISEDLAKDEMLRNRHSRQKIVDKSVASQAFAKPRTEAPGIQGEADNFLDTLDQDEKAAFPARRFENASTDRSLHGRQEQEEAQSKRYDDRRQRDRDRRYRSTSDMEFDLPSDDRHNPEYRSHLSRRYEPRFTDHEYARTSYDSRFYDRHRPIYYYDEEPVELIRINRSDGARYNHPEAFIDGDIKYVPTGRRSNSRRLPDEDVDYDYGYDPRYDSRRSAREESRDDGRGSSRARY